MTQTNQTQRPRLLVIEDKPHHITDARNVLEERVAGGYIGGADYASTYDEAQALLGTNRYDAIMSDVFFPRSSGVLEEQLGTKIADHAIKNNLPFVLVTDTNHHGTKTQPVCDYVRARNMQLIDNQGVTMDKFVYSKPFEEMSRSEMNDAVREETNRSARQKNWKSAYMVLTYVMTRFANNSAKFYNDKLVEMEDGTVRDKALAIRGVYSGFANNLSYHVKDGSVLEELENLNKYDPHFKESFDKYCLGLFDVEINGGTLK